MNQDEMQKQILEALTSGKLQPTQIILGDNVAKKIEVHEGGVGEQTINNYYGQQTESPAETTSQPQELPAEQPTGELTDGTIDQHRRLFKEAMLKAQDYKPKDSYRYLLSNTYDWVAAERWGKDLGIIKNYAQLEEILQDKRFREVPKNSQNLTKYRAYIDDNTRYPNWQCSVPDVEGFFRKFKEIADLINSIYKLGCHREHIKPYGSQ